MVKKFSVVFVFYFCALPDGLDLYSFMQKMNKNSAALGLRINTNQLCEPAHAWHQSVSGGMEFYPFTKNIAPGTKMRDGEEVCRSGTEVYSGDFMADLQASFTLSGGGKCEAR